MQASAAAVHRSRRLQQPMADRAARPPGEALIALPPRFSRVPHPPPAPPPDPGRTKIIARAAEAYGISIWTLYRALRELNRPKSVRRSDHGATRVAPQAEMERYAEIVAALKIRTTNKKGRHVSTARAIEFLETDGVETPEGLVKVAPGLLKRATIDRLLRSSGLDYARVTRPHAAVRFQARRSNELWHFDMSPSDLKQVEAPLWIEQGRGKPTLMLFSAVDDCSGVVYQEYRSVYGEDAESALRFLFNAFAAKPEPELPFQGLPVTIYMDNGPVSRSRVFQSVMGSLGVRVLTHLPPKADDRHTAARAKGKVERPFRTVKEVHETLYHFHKPKDEAEANLWMRRALVTYNNGDHRYEPHARIEHWLRHLPGDGVRAMGSWGGRSEEHTSELQSLKRTLYAASAKNYRYMHTSSLHAPIPFPPAHAQVKVERLFRPVKELHDTLYHLHKPKDEAEANLWMRRALVTYNNGDHRSEPHARIEHWLRHLPGDGVRAMCSWERFCAFAREPERRTVAGAATVTVAGPSYAFEPELARETGALPWGLADHQRFTTE